MEKSVNNKRFPPLNLPATNVELSPVSFFLRQLGRKGQKRELAKNANSHRFNDFGISFKGMNLNLLLAQAGQGGTQTVRDPKAQMMQMFLMIAAFGLIMYFMMIRPQQKRMKEQEAMLKTLKTGDKVITSSGIVGVVIAVKDRTVSLRSGETKMEIVKSSITSISESGAGES